MYKEDYYKILEVDKNSDITVIKKAYRKLAMLYHPDKNHGNKSAEDNFKKINEAYEILSDSKKRELYDLYGHAGVDQSTASSSSYDSGNINFGDIFSDIFGDMFGKANQKRGNTKQRGSDLTYTLNLSLKDAILGTTVKLSIKAYKHCLFCEGSGLKKGSKVTSCITCNGTGAVRLQQGFFIIQQACSHCGGTGSGNKKNCTDCAGSGRVSYDKTLSVKIPMGIADGDKIRLTGEGEAGLCGGSFGDLYIQVCVIKHEFFKRESNGDLYCEVPIDLKIAIIGGVVQIPTFFGEVDLKIPRYTQSGDVFTITGKGVKNMIKTKLNGNLICKVFVETPVNLDNTQLNLFLNFCETLEGKVGINNPITYNWRLKLKDFN